MLERNSKGTDGGEEEEEEEDDWRIDRWKEKGENEDTGEEEEARDEG